MASLRITLVALTFLGIAMSKTLATDYVVGAQTGWTLGFDYQAWANSKHFRVGDKIIFKYAKGAHNVVMVDQNSFKFCDAKSGAQTLESGNDIIEFQRPGTFFYFCSIGQHCQAGMKMYINVLA